RVDDPVGDAPDPDLLHAAPKVDASVDVLDLTELDPDGLGDLLVVESPIHALHPCADPPIEAICEGWRSGEKGGEDGPVLARPVELQVVDAARRALLLVAQGEVEEVLNRVDDPRLAHVEPPFVMTR